MTDEQLTNLAEKVEKGQAIQERMQLVQMKMELVKDSEHIGSWTPSHWAEIDMGNGLKGCLPELKEAAIDVLTEYHKELSRQFEEL